MSSARYAPLPNPRLGGPDADREILEAFELDKDDEDATEETRLTSSYDTSSTHHAATSHTPTTPGTYDFEREYDYDYPPPGSPPDLSAAIPNNYGNTNGVLPDTPARPVLSRSSLFRRLAGALLPQHYQMVPTEPAPSHAVGGGIENDGVFANVMAKPGRAVAIRSESGDVFMVPEETQSQAPPVSISYLRQFVLVALICFVYLRKSYVEAQADAVPPYWETTVHAPSSLDPNADMIVDDLPTGTWYLFLANIFISYFFQFVGFLFTYLLHSSHAAKYGSRVGLGLTLIQYGFYSRRQYSDDIGEVVEAGPSWNETIGMLTGMGMSTGSYDPSLVVPNATNGTEVEVTLGEYDLTSRDWVSFLMMTLGESCKTGFVGQT